ncbi:HIG1 domain family member 2A, mitochondrial [Gallus gallus]|uniref:HIG1 hypoxia inducible domain family member 2A n=1 Tax=Gallus gallus TaxID=9031 RepID=F1NUW0_CHICK|nr:HIG1 domain family member 2A, mitochondrial [Gallus gallus]XP_414550.3 HIG1 domain family member 2A, mitochondrial [Gallus gallus]|eukprot:XP_414550.3 HIG1 domain family member 2A, mitochondrial [Gallus gallus]
MAAGPPPPLEPIPLPVYRDEGFADKFRRKTRENPLVPLGCLCTLGVLTYGLISFKRGNTRHSQLMMRARVVAQGFTVAALLGGMVATALRARS